jgi:hypothetical protein
MLRLIRYDLYHIFEVHVPKCFERYVLTTSMNMKTQIEKLLAFGIWSIYTVLIGDLNIYAFKRGARPSRNSLSAYISTVFTARRIDFGRALEMR